MVVGSTHEYSMYRIVGAVEVSWTENNTEIGVAGVECQHLS